MTAAEWVMWQQRDVISRYTILLWNLSNGVIISVIFTVLFTKEAKRPIRERQCHCLILIYRPHDKVWEDHFSYTSCHNKKPWTRTARLENLTPGFYPYQFLNSAINIKMNIPTIFRVDPLTPQLLPPWWPVCPMIHSYHCSSGPLYHTGRKFEIKSNRPAWRSFLNRIEGSIKL